MTPMLEIVRDLFNRSVHGAPDLFVAVIDAVVEVDLVVLAQSIDAVEESSAAVNDLVGLVGPVAVVSRWAHEEMKESKCVGADGVEILLGRDEIALGLRHLRTRESD